MRIYVGQQTASGIAGGWNGGGNGGSGAGRGGGGASDVRRTPYALADRLVVAAGGAPFTLQDRDRIIQIEEKLNSQ